MDAPPLDALADAFIAAERPVVLTGLTMGWPEDADVASYRAEWTEGATLDVLMTDPQRFWRYFYPTARETAARVPNASHEALARLQREGMIAHHVTQSVDGLHQKAGSLNVIEVYGSLLTAICGRCGERYGLVELEPLIGEDGVPRCTTDDCAFPLRPSGTLWGEPLPPGPLQQAWECAGSGDLFVAFDCDLRTAPMSLLPSVPLTKGTPLYLVGEEPTQYDRYATLTIAASARSLLPRLTERILERSG